MYEIYFDTIDSTNTYAKQHVDEFPKDRITCIVADQQTAGYGRFQTQWISPAGVNLYTTFHLRLPSNTKSLTCLAQVLAASLVQVLGKAQLHPKIKWPNDLLLNGKKFAGVLCETGFKGSWVDLFLGIGVNVNMDAQDVKEINTSSIAATSLKVETNRVWDRKRLLQQLQEQLICDLEVFIDQGFAPFRDLLDTILAYKGKTVRCFDSKREWIGICHSLAADGRLNLLLPDQTMHAVLSGDIHLREYL